MAHRHVTKRKSELEGDWSVKYFRAKDVKVCSLTAQA